MKEKIKIKLKTYNNKIKGPSFRILCNGNLLDEKLCYMDSEYIKTFDIDIDKGLHSLSIEHFKKSPKDTKNKFDVAISLEELSFNGVKCSLVDLHDQFFTVTNWPYPIGKKIKNNLYFGYNGVYVYKFETPSLKYIIAQRKKYQKQITPLKTIEVTEDVFLKRLEAHLINEN